MRRMMLLLMLLVVPVNTVAQGVPVKGGGSSDLANVNSAKALEIVDGKSTRPTYNVTATGLVTTALYNLTVESAAGTGFKVYRICVGVSNATAAALVTVNVNRRTTAATGGAACTAEATAPCSVSKFDPADASYGGLAKTTATLGTIGPLVDGWGFVVGELGAGAADVPGPALVCQEYGKMGLKPITVLAGATNGLTVNVTAPGAGGLAVGSISMLLVAE